MPRYLLIFVHSFGTCWGWEVNAWSAYDNVMYPELVFSTIGWSSISNKNTIILPLSKKKENI